MKRFINRLPKKLLASLAIAGAIIGVTTMARAWWPERPTFTIAHPAPYVTFNSITDNPNYGDERTFFDAKNAANTNSGGFADRVKVEDGQTLLIRTYVHNNAANNLNTVPDGRGGFRGIAQNTKVRIFLPPATATSLRANSYVSASNATPAEVADTVDFYGDLPFNLEYIPGSAITYNNAHTQGMALSDQIVNGGAPLGYQSANGTIPGCFQYANIVTIKVKVRMQRPGMQVNKQVAIPGQPWKEDVTVNPGSTVSYMIGFKNTGNTVLNHVVINDKLPANVNIVPGSTYLANASNPNGIPAGSDAVVSNGLDIGDYAPGAVAYVKFKAVIGTADKLRCGVNKLVNTGEAYQIGKPSIKDTANVFVNKECVNPEPFYECSGLTLTAFDNRKINAEVSYKGENGAKFKLASYDFGDGKTLVTDKTKVEHVYDRDGTYIVRAKLTFTVKGRDVVAESDNCAKTVTFTGGTVVPPTTLPATGAGDIFGIFAATSVAGAVAHKLFLARKFARL